MNWAPIPADANSFIRLDALSEPDARKNSDLLFAPVRWNYQEYRLAHDFFGCIAIESLCTLVPRGDDPAEADADDCILTEFHNVSKLSQCSFGLAPFNKVGRLSRKYIQ